MKSIILMFLCILSSLSIHASTHCNGKERWDIKTLEDGFSLTDGKAHVTFTGVEQLISLKAPIRPREREKLERLIDVTAVDILGFKVEREDSDIHIVISKPGEPNIRMVAEIPDPICAPALGDTWIEVRAKLTQAVGGRLPTGRMYWFKSPPTVFMTGVLFFDKLHRQIGAAPNGIELHPVIDIQTVRNPHLNKQVAK